jgi:hypothetical protein
MTTLSLGARTVCLCTCLVACNDPLEPVSCVVGDSVTVSVKDAPLGLPQFSWSPPCLIGSIRVDSGTFGSPAAWAVFADTNRIPPPVRYGESPPRVREALPQPLILGSQYTVSVWIWGFISGGSSYYWRAGVASFVR